MSSGATSVSKDKGGVSNSEYVLGKRTADIRKTYRLGKAIGQPGQFGHARVATHIESGKVRAVKVISKARFKRHADRHIHYAQLRAEIEVMRKMQHPNIIKFIDVFEDKHELYIVMGLCTGGELFDRLQQEGSLTEQVAARVLRQMCEGVAYMHEKGVAHCDLKPDNFLFETKDAGAKIKIIDFGMSKFVDGRNKYFKALCGTPYYVAPEVIRGNYTKHCDMWSLGVVMFVMLFGYPPFYADQNEWAPGEADREIFRQVKRGFDPTVRKGYGAYFPKDIPVSDSARDLIAKLLTLDTATRLTAQEALEHSWMTGKTASSDPLRPVVLSNLRSFTASNKFKAAILGLMTDHLSSEEVTQMRSAFKAMDTDGDGTITVDELKVAISKMTISDKGGAGGGGGNGAKKEEKKKGEDSLDALSRSTGNLPELSDAEAARILKMADIDGDGKLSYKELLLTCVHRKLIAKEERLLIAFQRLDLDGDGLITKDEIEKVLGKDSKHARELIAEADKNGDGVIDYEEFVQMWGDKQDALAEAKPSPRGPKKE